MCTCGACEEGVEGIHGLGVTEVELGAALVSVVHICQVGAAAVREAERARAMPLPSAATGKCQERGVQNPGDSCDGADDSSPGVPLYILLRSRV